MHSGIHVAAAVFSAATMVAGCSPSAESPSASLTSVPSESPAAQPPAATPLLASVVAAPVPVPATDGKDHLAYELWLTNPLPTEVTLTSLAVVAGDRTLLTLSGDKLAYWTRIMGDTERPATKLGPGLSALVWLDVAVDRPLTAARRPFRLTFCTRSMSPSLSRSPRCYPRR